MTDQELEALAGDIVQGKIFGSWMLSEPERLANIFLPLGFGGAECLAEQDVWGIYEYRHKTKHFTKDALPIFISFKTLSSEDCKKLKSILKQLYRNMADNLGEENG